jgi:hypothetical protein
VNSDVNAKGNLALAPDGADGKLANVGFAAMQKPKFYREREQAAKELAELFRDKTAKQMLQKAAERWRELARLAGPRKRSRAASKTKKR